MSRCITCTDLVWRRVRQSGPPPVCRFGHTPLQLPPHSHQPSPHPGPPLAAPSPLLQTAFLLVQFRSLSLSHCFLTLWDGHRQTIYTLFNYDRSDFLHSVSLSLFIHFIFPLLLHFAIPPYHRNNPKPQILID